MGKVQPIRILLDMDEVIADFIGGACRAWGVSKDAVLSAWEPGIWDMQPPLTKALDLPELMTVDQFWLPLNTVAFWEGLDRLPSALPIIELVTSVTKDWHVVTAPSRSPSSYTGKVLWLKKLFGERFDRFAITPHKYIFAGENTCLIDDRESNLEEFKEHGGGHAILFPAHHNRLHGKASDPVAHVYEELQRIL